MPSMIQARDERIGRMAASLWPEREPIRALYRQRRRCLRTTRLRYQHLGIRSSSLECCGVPPQGEADACSTTPPT